MSHQEPPNHQLNRREFFRASAHAAVGTASGVSLAGLAGNGSARAASPELPSASAGGRTTLPVGTLGKAKISRMLLGGNLISGYMHCRDLKYVGSLFRAYVTEKKLIETLALADQHGINTVFETGGEYVHKYNREFGTHLQFIPHIEVTAGQSESSLRDHIQHQIDTGAVALYVWGVAADKLMQAGAADQIGKAVELAKNMSNLPVGVGAHSLLVPMACEQQKVPCDFYVKTLHSDNYPSATPKAQRKEFIWLDGGEGWYDNMWCINPEETIAFMKTVAKPWIAFKVLAAGAIYPREAFVYALKNGADFLAVGMLDFQIKDNCELLAKILRNPPERERPWRA